MQDDNHLYSEILITVTPIMMRCTKDTLCTSIENDGESNLYSSIK